MDYDRILPGLVAVSGAKILFVVLDGLGGLPHPATGLTEMETADLPNLDALARRSSCGLHDPVLPGITPGSGPGHLGIFGYDPVDVQIGRGELEAHGIGFELKPGDVAARINFCTLDERGNVTDRRAGRIPTEENAKLTARLESISLEGVQVFVRTVKEHRAVVVFRGEGLDGAIEDTDPQRTGVPPRPAKALTAAAERTADLANRFVEKAQEILASCHPANGVLLRGFSCPVALPGFRQKYGLRAAAIASYPMYRGLARVVGMEVLDTGDSIEAEVETLEAAYGDFDFFFLHYKPSDSRGEDGDFEAKARALETFDGQVPRLTALRFDAVLVTGDHSTPAVLKSHSWHPVPFLVHSKWCIAGGTAAFSEKACSVGMEGRLPSRCLLPLVLAHARRLEKYGA